MSASDTELLRQYAYDGSHEAFAELVARYLDLVFTAARRQVRSTEVAQEITQSVFIRLSQGARQIRTGTPLAAWLYLVTRRTALNALRHEARRLAREQAAFEISTMNSTPSSDWAQIEPLLDEAMDALPSPDRSAVLLRYFENKSLRDVGQTLGISEDGAQKRVSRAIEQLRLHLSKRGVAVSAAGLVTGLSGNAIQAAPIGLGSTVTLVSALSVSTAPAGVTGGTFLTMTTIQKTLVASVLVAVLGTGFYEARVASLQGAVIQDLRDRAGVLATQEKLARRERDEAIARLAALSSMTIAPGTVPKPDTQRDAGIQSAIASLVTRTRQLRQLFADSPGKRIPELELLTEDDWLKASMTVQLDTDEHIRSALASLRGSAKSKFVPLLSKAMTNYRATNNGVMPADLNQLGSYFDPPINNAILARYTSNPDEFPPAAPGGILVSERLSAVVDAESDNLFQMFSNGYASNPVRNYTAPLQIAIRAYRNATNQFAPATAEELAPYLPSPVPPDELQAFVERTKNAPRGGVIMPPAVPAKP